MTRLFRTILSFLRVTRWKFHQSISIGSGVKLDKGVRLKATDGATLSLGDRVAIDQFADVYAKIGTLTVGNDTFVGPWTRIIARENVSIGSDCLIAESVVIRDQNHKVVAGELTRKAGFTSAPIQIGNNVWIGAKATIVPGVTIGDNAVIGANAVVTEDVPPNVVVAGVPAKRIRDITQ